jgi:hypothetical protein
MILGIFVRCLWGIQHDFSGEFQSAIDTSIEPANKVRVLSSRRLCCPAFLGTTTLSDSLPAVHHFTL